MKKLALFSILVFFFFSCEKERRTNRYFAENYPKILENIEIDCEEENSSSYYYIKAKINNEEYCRYYNGKAGDFRLISGAKYFTQGTSTAGEKSNLRNAVVLKLGDLEEEYNACFWIEFPDFNINRSVYHFLDSLTAIQNHENVLGKEDVVIPPGATKEEIGMLYAGVGYLDGFLISMASKVLVNEELGSVFFIHTISGSQDDSFLRFNEVKKYYEPDGVYYFMDISFECNLYHWEQYGQEGLWAEVRDGRIVFKLKLRT